MSKIDEIEKRLQQFIKEPITANWYAFESARTDGGGCVISNYFYSGACYGCPYGRERMGFVFCTTRLWRETMDEGDPPKKLLGAIELLAFIQAKKG